MSSEIPTPGRVAPVHRWMAGLFVVALVVLVGWYVARASQPPAPLTSPAVTQP